MNAAEMGPPEVGRQPSQVVILCEGYYDRPFWRGWLEALGLQSLYDPQKGGQRPVDPWKNPVVGGEFAFQGQSGTPFVRLKPCGSDARTREALRTVLAWRAKRPTHAIIAALDWNKIAEPTVSSTADTAPRLENFLRQMEPAAKPLGNNLWQLDDGAYVYLIDWTLVPSALTPQAGVPRKNTLERLVCACLAETFPSLAQAVEKWLATRPDMQDGDDIDPKGYAWSYLAGWMANSGCDYFFRQVWQTPAIRQRLERKLTELGHWQAVCSLLGE